MKRVGGNWRSWAPCKALLVSLRKIKQRGRVATMMGAQTDYWTSRVSLGLFSFASSFAPK